MSAFKNPLFRPADFAIEEINYNAISASWKHGPELLDEKAKLGMLNEAAFPPENKGVLFPVGCPLPAVRQLRFKTNDPVQVLLTYQPAIPGFPTNVAAVLSTAHKVDQLRSLVLNFLLD